jgi:hypothetical protein
MAPRVSIVVPVFNRREQVISAVDSALAQTFGDLEIIVVDDGSTDRTPDTLATLRPQAKLLRLPENRGPSPARNVGTAIARGEFVMLLDSDDELLPEAIARHVGVLDRHPQAVMSYSRLRQNTAFATILPDEPPPTDLGARIVQIMDGQFAGLFSSCLIRRVALEAIGGCDESLATSEDTDLFVRLAPLGPFVFIPERLTVRNLLPDRYSLKAPPGDVGWNAVIDKLLASEHGDLVRPHLGQLRGSRHARLFDRLAAQEKWAESLSARSSATDRSFGSAAAPTSAPEIPPHHPTCWASNRPSRAAWSSVAIKHREVNGRAPTNLRCASLPGFRPGKIVEARQLAEVEAKPGHVDQIGFVAEAAHRRDFGMEGKSLAEAEVEPKAKTGEKSVGRGCARHVASPSLTKALLDARP